MAKIIIINIIRFILLTFFQVALLKNIGYYNIATPFPYILFILLLPLGISNISLYIIALLTGLTIDAFYDSLGIHASACVALAFFRIFFINITLDLDLRESFNTPNLTNMKFKWYSMYLLLGTFIQHLVLFFIESFSFQNFSNTFISTIFSTIFTLSILFIISLLTYNNKGKLNNY